MKNLLNNAKPQHKRTLKAKSWEVFVFCSHYLHLNSSAHYFFFLILLLWCATLFANFFDSSWTSLKCFFRFLALKQTFPHTSQLTGYMEEKKNNKLFLYSNMIGSFLHFWHSWVSPMTSWRHVWQTVSSSNVLLDLLMLVPRTTDPIWDVARGTRMLWTFSFAAALSILCTLFKWETKCFFKLLDLWHSGHT